MTDDLQNLLAGMVRPLEWDVDSRRVRFDPTMEFSKGYNWDGWDLRQEAHGLGVSYAIWREDFSDKYSLYSTADGLYIQGGMTEAEAQSAAQADYTARIASALNLDAVLALVAAAYADAAEAANCGCAPDRSDCLCNSSNVPFCYRDGLPRIADLAQTDPLATAALARMLADARAEGLGGLLMVEWIDEVDAVCRRYKIKTPSFRSAVSDLIRAMKGEQG